MITIKPSPFLVNYEEERNKLLKFVFSGNPCMILGKYGVGKTSILLWLKEELKRRGKNVVYIDGDIIKSVNEVIDSIRNELSLFEKYVLRKKIPNQCIIVIDEADELNQKILLFIKNLYDKDKIFNFVLAAVSDNNIPPSILHRIGNRVICLTGIKEQEILNFLKLKVGEKIVSKFEDGALKELWKICGGNPRKIIEAVNTILVDINIDEIEVIDKTYIKEKLTKQLSIIPLKSVKLSPSQKRIVEVLKNGPKTLKEIAEALNTSIHTVGARISELKRMGVIIEIEDRPKKYSLVRK